MSLTSNILRTVGQIVENQKLRDFEIYLEGETLVLRGQEDPKLQRESLWQRTWRELMGRELQPPPTIEVRCDPEELARLEAKARERRGAAAATGDDLEASRLLRLIGNYVELKKARLLSVKVNNPTVSIEYESAAGVAHQEEHTVFSMGDLSSRLLKLRSPKEGD